MKKVRDLFLFSSLIKSSPGAFRQQLETCREARSSAEPAAGGDASRREGEVEAMAEVFSNSPCMLGKRVLSPHPHSLMGGQLDFSSKKRRLGLGTDQGGAAVGRR